MTANIKFRRLPALFFLLLLALLPIEEGFAGDITVTLTGSVNEINAGSLYLTDTDTGAPVDTATSAVEATDPVTTTIPSPTNNNWLVDLVGSGNGGSFTPQAAGQTERWDTSNASATSAMSTRIVAGGNGDMIQDHSTDSNRTAHAVIEVDPAAASTIAFDSATATNDTNTATLSWTHTFISSNDGKLIVGVAFEGGGGQCAETVSTVTHDGNPLTFAVSALIVSGNGFCQRTEIWYLDISFPAAILVTLTGTVNEINAGSLYLTDTDTGAPVDTATSAVEATDPVTTTIPSPTNNNWLVDLVGSGNGGSFTPQAAGQTERWDTSATSATSAMSTRIVAGGDGDMIQDHSTDSNRTAHAVMEVDPAAASTIAFDSATATNDTNTATLTWMHTFTSNDGKLIVGVAFEGGGGQCSETVSSVTHDGDPLTLAVSAIIVSGSGFCQRVEIWYLDFVTLSAVDHYAISYPLGTPGITCEAQAVRVTAHDAADSPVLVNTTITISTDPAADSWALNSGSGVFDDLGGGGSSTYQFSGESFVDLWLTETTTTTTPHIDIDVTDGSATDQDGVAEDDKAQFDDAVFRFFAGATPESIGTQISAKPSSTAPGDQTIQLRSVRTSTTTLECEAGFTGTETIELAFQCNDPTTCATANGVTVTAAETKAIADNPDAGVTTYTSVNMDFSVAGIAAFSFRYDDAGEISLHARKVLLADAGDSPPTTAATLVGSSNTFVVRPFGFAFTNVNAGGFANPAANTPGGTIFTTAGSNFEAEVGAYLWVGAEDANSDGNPDSGVDITDNGAALNYDFNTTITAVAPFKPASGSVGSVNNGSILTGAFTNGVATVSNLQYTEVGSMTLQANAIDYLGDASADIVGDSTHDGSSGVVGRFTPFAFNVTLDTAPEFTPGCSSDTTPFTYLDQGFNYSTAPMVTMVAVNELGGTTSNYDGTWWKLADFAETYVHVVGDPLTGGVTLDDTVAGHTAIDCSGDTCDGSFQTTFAGPFTYARSTTAIGPFNGVIDISFAVTDADGVSYAANPFVVNNIEFTGSNNQQRWGRLVVSDAAGPEQMVLNVDLTTEYYDGTSYLQNSDDDCTVFTLSSQVDLTTVDSGTLDGDQAMVIGSGTTSITTGDPVLTDGSHTFTFSAPGVDNVGFVEIEIDLTTAIMDWLEFDWDGDGNFDDHPVGRASFGIITRPKQLIYTREPWN